MLANILKRFSIKNIFKKNLIEGVSFHFIAQSGCIKLNNSKAFPFEVTGKIITQS